MLKKFQVILQRDSLKEDLDSKFMVIFHNYGLDLETVQRLYEKQKASPPSVRNAAARDGVHHVGAPADAAHRGADAQVPAEQEPDADEGVEEDRQDVQPHRAHHRRVRDPVAPGLVQVDRAEQGRPAGDADHPPPVQQQAVRQLRPRDPAAHPRDQVPARA